MTFTAPHIDYAGLSPVIALSAGIVVVLLAGVLSGRHQKLVVSALSLTSLATAAGLCIWQWGTREDLVSGALRLDELGLAAALIAMFAAAVCIPMSWRDPAAAPPDLEPRHGDFQALLLASVLGMTLLAQAQNLIAFFVALELLSVPLYVLCGSAIHRATSLESGLKYLIVGSLGSATLLYGLSFIYGAAGSTDFNQIDQVISNGNASDSLVLMGVALIGTGLAFKISIAPFHQWTPDVYQGAPTPITAFMAVATKAAAFGVILRLFDVALIDAASTWGPALAALAAFTIVVGNVGAIGQSSLKRLLAYSSVAQAGYMLAGVVVSTRLGVQAVVFYLAAYLIMNLAELPEQRHGQHVWREGFEMMKQAFPDLQGQIEDIVAADDRVALRLRFRGTHSGEFLGIPPTGHRIEYVSHEFYRVTDGLIAEEWICSDTATLFRQLG